MMKETQDTNETFLAQWLAGALTDGQLKQLVGEDDFQDYQKLRQSLESYQIQDPDMAQNYAAIKTKKIAKLDKRQRVIPIYRYAAIAATLLLFFGLYQMFVFSNERQAGFGTTAKLALNDHSHVTLNAKSTVSYPTLFQYIRTLKLDGEAYFEVAKGSTFTVETPQGNVRVLGTKFNVLARPGFFEAVCYEGKVQVSHNDFCIILKPGEAVRFYGKKQETWKINEPKPLWTSGESGFRNTPLQYVITELENQYHKEIQYPKQMAAVRFTGSFTHKNLEIALQSVCLPLHLRYTETQPGKIVLSE